MRRIPAVPEAEAGFFGRLVYRFARRRFGDVPEPFAVARHHRRLFWAGDRGRVGVPVGAHGAAEADARPRRVPDATVVGCSWCVDFGTMLQRLDGLDVDRLQHIDEYDARARSTSRAERLAIAYADAMTAQPMTVTDAQVAELEAVLGRAGLVELTHAIALENMRARSEPRARHHRPGVRRGLPGASFSGLSTPSIAAIRLGASIGRPARRRAPRADSGRPRDRRPRRPPGGRRARPPARRRWRRAAGSYRGPTAILSRSAGSSPGAKVVGGDDPARRRAAPPRR